MIHNNPATLQGSTLKRTTATTDHYLQMCFKRVAFGNSEAHKAASGIGSTFNRLGNAAHKLIEEATKGDFDQFDHQIRKDAIEERWNVIVDKEYADFQEKTLVSVDLPFKWRGYATTKLKSVKLALNIAEGRADTVSGIGGLESLAPGVIKSESEKPLSAFNERLFGKIDLLRRTGEGLELVDYKSGSIYEPLNDKTTTRKVKERYSQQMLVYAGLVNEALGEWPVKLILHSLVDGECEIPVDVEMIEAHCRETIARLDKYNEQVEDGIITGTPSKENCKFCDFQPLCTDFFDGADESWGDIFSRTVSGKILAVESPVPSLISLEVTGGDHTLGTATIRGLPTSVTSELMGKLGSIISINGLKPSKVRASDLSCGDGTQVWLWD